MRHLKPSGEDGRHFIKRDLPTARRSRGGARAGPGGDGDADGAHAFAFHLAGVSDSFVITMTAKKGGIDLPFFTEFMSLWFGPGLL